MQQFLEKLSSNILKFVPFVTALLVPLFFLPLTTDFFFFNKQYLLFILATISLAAFIVRTISRNKLLFTLSPALFPLLLLTTVYIISSVLGMPNPQTTLFGTTAFIASLFIIFVTVTSSQKNDQVIKFGILGITISSILLSLIAILNQLGLLSKIGGGAAWLANKNFTPAGDYFVLITYLVPVLISLIVVALYTRAMYTKLAIVTAIALIGVGGAFAIKPLLPQDGQTGLAHLPYSAGWSIATDTMKNLRSALIGTGPDTYPYDFTRFKPASINQNDKLWSVRFGNSSNEIFTLLSTIGLIGLGAFLAAHLRTVFAILKTETKIKEDTQAMFLTTFISVLFLSFIFLPANIVSITATFVALTLLTIKLKLNSDKTNDVNLQLTTNPEVSSQSDNNYHQLPKTSKFSASVLPWLFTLLSVILIFVFWTRAINIYRANLAVMEASQNIKSNPTLAFNKQLEAANLDPYNPYHRINLSRSYMIAAKEILTSKDAKEISDDDKKKALSIIEQSIAQAKAATQLDPLNVTVWENSSDIYTQLTAYGVPGSGDWALATYSQAIFINPNDPIVYTQLGTFYFNIGDTELATRMFDRAMALKPNWNVAYYNLSSVYKARKDYAKSLAYINECIKLTPPESDVYKKLQEEMEAIKKLAPTPTPTPAAAAPIPSPTTK